MQKILKLPEVMKATALSRSSIYAFVADNSFPKPIKLGEKATGWLESEVSEWIEKRIQLREVNNNDQ